MRYKKAIQVGGNITDIMWLPCVLECRKRDNYRGGHHVEFYYTLVPFMMYGRGWHFAHPGDWLCEDYEGKWHLLTDKEYRDGDSDK